MVEEVPVRVHGHGRVRARPYGGRDGSSDYFEQPDAREAAVQSASSSKMCGRSSTAKTSALAFCSQKDSATSVAGVVSSLLSWRSLREEAIILKLFAISVAYLGRREGSDTTA